MPKIEHVKVTLPAGFDASKSTHMRALERKIMEMRGAGFEITNIDPIERVAHATRTVAITEISNSDDENLKTVDLVKGTKPSDGEKLAVRLADQYPGFEMTRFEPHLHKAELRRLDKKTSRCRTAIAVAIGVKPWQVQVTPAPDGGFEIELPDSYVPSKHDDKLDEVATAIVGQLGWWVETNPPEKTAMIHPGDPPTFPPAIPYEFSRTPPPYRPDQDNKWAHIPLGWKLQKPGHEGGEVLTTDFGASAHMQISGLSGGGKGVVLTSLIAGALARGWELTILDPVKSGVDFIDFKDFCRPGGWGCEDLTEAVCALTMAYNEGLRRKKLIKEQRVQKWTQLPSELGVRPLLVVSDEVSSLLSLEKVPKMKKDSPLVMEIEERNLLRSTALNYLGRIARELRFVGVSLAISSQVSSTTTGVPTEMRTNLGMKVLLGVKPTDNNRRLALAAHDAVPQVPRNIADDQKAGRGVGVYEFEGHKPGVFKGFFAPPSDFSDWLVKLGVPRTDRPRPTPGEIARYTPSLDSDEAITTSSDGGGNYGAGYGGQPSGTSISADFGKGDICATCGGVVDPLTGNCRCSR